MHKLDGKPSYFDSLSMLEKVNKLLICVSPYTWLGRISLGWEGFLLISLQQILLAIASKNAIINFP